MTALKSAEFDRFIARPDPRQPIVLLYGPDAGLVRERVDALVLASVDDPSDPFALARISGEDVSWRHRSFTKAIISCTWNGPPPS